MISTFQYRTHIERLAHLIPWAPDRLTQLLVDAKSWHKSEVDRIDILRRKVCHSNRLDRDSFTSGQVAEGWGESGFGWDPFSVNFNTRSTRRG